MPKPTIGIIGAGKLGTTLGRLFTKAGYPVLISGSGSAEKIQLTIEVLVPGAKALTNQEVSEQADIIILALPLSKYQELDAQLLADKLVIDAMNYWWEIDGTDNIYSDEEQSSSERVQAYFSESRVFKAFNHIGYHSLGDDAKLNTQENRKVVLFAGDFEEDVDAVATLISNIGFEPLYIGDLNRGVILETGSPLFGASLGLAEVKQLVEESLAKYHI